MDNRQKEAQHILLSREELQFILQQIDATMIPGLDRDPLGELTPEGRQLAMTVAERALRARGLTQVDEAIAAVNGSAVRIDQQLLSTIGTCAYSESAIFLFHREAQTNTPLRYFGHIRDENIVVHTLLAPDLHLFSLLPSREQLCDELLTVCACSDTQSPAHEFMLSFPLFEQVQQAIDAKEWEGARQSLANANVDDVSATAYLELFTADYQISVLQTVKQQDNTTAEQREFVLFQSQATTWLAFAAVQPDDQTAMLVKTTNRSELQQLWSTWL